jgi:hypothetical protein
MKKIQAIGIKESGKPFRIINQKLFRQELDSLPDGKYRVTVEKLRKNKSLPQLGYLFACVYPLSMQFLNDAGWEFTNNDQVDAFWKDLYAKKEVINRHTGEIRMIPALKRDFLSIDMMNYIESIRQHCSEYLGGYIPGPEEQSNINFSE